MRQIKFKLKMPNIHLEARKGTQKQCIEYCTEATFTDKDGTIKKKIPGPNGFNVIHWGNPKEQGKRSDIDEIYQDIEEGCTLKEILSFHRGNALRMIHAIEKAALINMDLNKCDQEILRRRKIKNEILSKLESENSDLDRVISS